MMEWSWITANGTDYGVLGQSEGIKAGNIGTRHKTQDSVGKYVPRNTLAMMIMQTHRLVDHSLDRRQKLMGISWGGDTTSPKETARCSIGKCTYIHNSTRYRTWYAELASVNDSASAAE